MLGSWSQEGYEHEASKSIRWDRFCGLLLDMVNQEDLTDERIQKWVKQLKEEGILNGASVSVAEVINGAPNEVPLAKFEDAMATIELEKTLDDQNSGSHSTAGFTPHYNSVKGRTMWTSPDGTKSFVTVDAMTSRFAP
jgi:flavodoxin I